MVEDDELFTQTLSEFLAADGRFEIIGWARDGAGGVELAISLGPDVVLMDIGLPVMDGVEASRQIHAAHASLPVVLISGLDYAIRPQDLRGPREFCSLSAGPRSCHQP